VSITSNVSGVWSAPKALTIKNDYNFAEKANYFLADNRKTLLMSVQRSDSHGDRDLYITFMNADSTWSEPLNLGDVINTAAEESGPFLAPDDKTLYFSSKGFSGYGGNDIYVSRRLDDTWTNWSEPENLGPEINSPLEDLFFNIPSSSDFAYYSRGVTETNTDIFRVKLPIIKSPEPWVTVRGKVIDKTTGKPVGAKIIYEQLPSGKELGITQSNPQTGEYEIRLPAGQLYGIRTEAEGKISENQNLDLRGITANKVIDQKNIDLSPLIVTSPQPEAVIVLNNVFFDFDKATMKPESYPELNRLVTFLNNNAGVNVQIAGHTDSVGPEPYNLDLSKRRANSVVQYLYNKGVTKEKVKTVFFGETKPIDTNATREGREKNRRVEFKIVNL